ncbi:unnamed protein product [Brassica rapa subsp. narinosa]
MKNVAKCDTWCELQNPVNHRVFERKLHCKPSGRGHVCLAKDARSVLTCGGEFNSRHIVRRSGPKALNDLKSSTRNQSGEASSAMDQAQVPWKAAPERAKYERKTDSEHVPRGKDEKDFEKRVKECLKLSGGKRMGAGDSSRSDAERSNPVRRSIRAMDQCRLSRPGSGLTDVVALIVVCITRLTACLGICVLRASACGLPIRPVLKHGPRSVTCVRVNGTHKECWSIKTAGRWSWKSKSAKECVTTHLPNQLAPKMDGAEAGDLYPAVRARARPR